MADLLNIDPQETAPETIQTPEVKAADPAPEPKEPKQDDLADKSIDELKELEKKMKAAPKEDNEPEETNGEDNPKADDVPPVPQTPKIDYEKEWKNSQSMIGRQSAEVAAYRQKLAELEARINASPKPEVPKEQQKVTADELTAKFLEDPRAAMAILDGERQAVEDQKRADAAERSRILHEIAPDVQKNAETIAKIMKEEDKLTDEQILHIAKNIDKVPPDIIYNYNQRANQRLREEALKQEIEKLKGMPDKIKKAAEGQSIIQKTASAAAGQKQSFTQSQLNDMSPAELRKVEEEMKRRG